MVDPVTEVRRRSGTRELRDYGDRSVPLRLSYTSLARRMECAAAWAYYYAQGLPLRDDGGGRFDVGVLTAKIHEVALARFAPLGTVLGEPPPEDEVLGVCSEIGWTADMPARPGRQRREDVERASAAATRLLLALYQHFAGCTVYAIEREITWEPAGKPAPFAVYARPDVMLRRPAAGGLVIVDDKTTSRLASAGRLALDLQATLYALVTSRTGEAAGLPVEAYQLRTLVPGATSAKAKPPKPADLAPRLVCTTPGGPVGPGLAEHQAAVLASLEAWITSEAVAIRARWHPHVWSTYNTPCSGCAYADLCDARVAGDADRVARVLEYLVPDTSDVALGLAPGDADAAAS